MNAISPSLEVSVENRAVFATILTIGPEYKNHRGGIGAVLEEYAANIQPFNFLASYKPGGWLSIGWHYIKFLFSFTRYLIVNRQIKIVHIHTSSYGSFIRKSLVVLIAKLFGKKTIMHIHGSEFQVFYHKTGVLKGVVRKILNLNNLIICLSPQWVDFFSKFIPAEKLVVLNNPVSGKYKLEKKKADNKIQFLFLGRIGQRKGIFDLVSAINELPVEKRNRMRLVAGGDGEIDKLTSLVKQFSLEENVIYAGWVTGTKKAELLSASDVYILPSYNEGLPISILEAMTGLLPVISTPVGGITEIVRDNENGILVQPGDVKAIKSAIEYFIDNPAKIAEYGKVSGQKARPFLIDSVVLELKKTYTAMLNKKKVDL